MLKFKNQDINQPSSLNCYNILHKFLKFTFLTKNNFSLKEACLKSLIREEDIREAHRNNQQLKITKDTVITPGAKDLAKELSIDLSVQANASPLKAKTYFQDSWPFAKIAIASDHGGFYMKEDLKSFLRDKGKMVVDLGPANAKACDYPDYAFKVAQKVSDKSVNCGIVIDSIGIGSAMAANKVVGVLAAKCNNATEAKSAREHNFANILTLGSKIIGITAAQDIVMAFLETKGGAERHQNRIFKILNYEKG
jgi:ribose 5-phosphate isomerase B